MTVQEMQSAAELLAGANIGYDQWQRWSFFNRDTKEVVAGMEADCASTCGAIAVLGGYNADLSNPFWTGTFKERLTAAGFTAVPFTSLAQVKEGCFILNETHHVEFAYTADRWFSARIDERGKITGGKAGNQTGWETGFKPAYTYSRGWDWVLYPPETTVQTVQAVKTSIEWPKVSLLTDGQFGPVTVKAYQALLKGIGHYTGYIDGQFGPMSVKAEQAWLTRLGHYTGLLDGARGPLTIKALQNFLRTKSLYAGYIDGQFGPFSVEALQRYLNDQARFFA